MSVMLHFLGILSKSKDIKKILVRLGDGMGEGCWGGVLSASRPGLSLRQGSYLLSNGFAITAA